MYSNMTSFKRFGSKHVVKYAYIGISSDRQRHNLFGCSNTYLSYQNRNNSWRLGYILILPRVDPLCRYFTPRYCIKPVVKSIYIQVPMTYFLNRRRHLLDLAPHRWCNGQRAVDRGFKLRQGQAKDYKIGIYCFSVKHTALRRKSKDWLALNRDNVSEWGDMSIRDCCFSELAL